MLYYQSHKTFYLDEMLRIGIALFFKYLFKT